MLKKYYPQQEYNINMKVKLVKKIDEAKDTKSFIFQPEKAILFSPGQYLYYTLPKLNYPDAKGATRHFTIASSPTEDGLMLTTKIRAESGYKKTLDELPMGSFVEIQEPNGTFFFDEGETEPHVFLAGGVGITPFRSMIKYVVDKKIKTPIYLIYSNSDESTTFKKELDEITKSNPNIKVHYVVSSIEGHLDQTKIDSIIGSWNLKNIKFTWWICGPPPFTSAMEDILSKMKVPGGQIRSEKFTGY
jgi:glycine betaine catabolism B